MRRRDWLLLFAAYEGAPDGLDPIRFQKGLFLFAMDARVPLRERYAFKPYDYGPMSPGIYADLDTLVEQGLLTRDAVAGKTWSRYRATEAGIREAMSVLERAQSERKTSAAEKLYELKQMVASVSFNDLLERVYSAHPEFAVNSVFRRSS